MSAVEKLSITLPTEMISIIKGQVETGRYASTSEVLREAVRIWMRQEDEHAERIQSIRGRIKQSLKDTRPSVSIEDAFVRLENSIDENDKFN